MNEFLALTQRKRDEEEMVGRSPISSFTEIAANSAPAGLVKKAVTEGIPTLAREGTRMAGEAIRRQNDLLREGKVQDAFSSNWVSDLVKYTAGGLASLGKTVLEETVGRAVGREVVRESFEPRNETERQITQFAFKEDNPKSWQQITEDIQGFVETSEDATPWEKAHLAPLIGLAGFSLDAFPGSPKGAKGLSKALIKDLAKEVNIVEVVGRLRAEGVPQQVIDRAAESIATARTQRDVRTAFQNATREALAEVQGVTPASFVEPINLNTQSYSPGSLRTAEAFARSSDRQPVPTQLANEVGEIQMGTYGRNAVARKSALGDRFPADEIPNALDRAFLAVRASNDPVNWRSGNIAIISRADDGFRAVYVRPNDAGALEVINAHVIPESKMPSYLEDIGAVPGTTNQTRTDIGSLEDSSLVQLAYGSDLSVAEQVNLINPKVSTPGETTALSQNLDPQQTSGLSAADQAIGQPQDTKGLQVLSQLGDAPDAQQVQRAFAGEYTAGDGMSRTLDEVAEDVMITSDEPLLTARTVNALKSAKTQVLEYVQNTEERIRQLIQDPNLRVSDASDPYLAMTLMPGRLGTKVEGTQRRLEGLFSDMGKVAKTSKSNLKQVRSEVNEYLWLRHAPERNAALEDGAAGITTKEALERMDELKKSPRFAEIERLADEISVINREALDMLLDAGVIKRELFDLLTDKYQNYVPLNRIIENASDIADGISGRGFDVRSTGLRKAKGSSREVADILENTILNYEQAAIRSEKNIVDRATLKFVQDNKEALSGLMRVRRPRGLETTNDPRILQLFDEGKRVWIEFKNDNLAIAFRGVGRQYLPEILQPVGAVSRLIAGLATRFNPEFAPPNIIRDIQERTVFLAAQKQIGGKGALKAVTKDPQSIKGITDFLRGIDSEDALLYKEMKELGGTTGGLGLSTRKKVKLNIRSLERLENSTPLRYANNLVEYIDNWNTIFEDASRLTAYKTALESGMSKNRAAAIAKEATVNFNRMGKGGPVVNALYIFSNASLQGAVKTIRAMKDPKVLAGLTATVGTAVVAINEWNESVDPDWRSRVSKWDITNGLPVMLPSDDGEVRVITLPVGYGIKPIRVAADYAYQMANAENVSAKDMIDGIMTSVLESYNPIGGTDMLSAATPTILDVPLEIARNQKWSGSAIKPDFDPYAPESVKYFDSLENKLSGHLAISLTEKLAGYGVELSPADIVYAFEQYISGAGRSAQRTFELFAGMATGELPPISDFPFVARFYKERQADEIFDSQTQSNLKELFGEDRRDRFYIKKKAEQAWDSMAELTVEEKKTKLVEMKRDDPELFDRVKNIIEAEKLGLTGQDKQLKSATVAVRAQYIAGQLKRLGDDTEAKRALLKDYQEKKILTSAVVEEIKALNKELQ